MPEVGVKKDDHEEVRNVYRRVEKVQEEGAMRPWQSMQSWQFG